MKKVFFRTTGNWKFPCITLFKQKRNTSGIEYPNKETFAISEDASTSCEKANRY